MKKWFPWPKEPNVHLDIEKVGASRAMYQGKGIPPRIRVEMTTEAGQKIDFELDIENAAKLIEEMTISYYAINPELKTRRRAG